MSRINGYFLRNEKREYISDFECAPRIVWQDWWCTVRGDWDHPRERRRFRVKRMSDLQDIYEWILFTSYHHHEQRL